jgi:hypothetical protein
MDAGQKPLLGDLAGLVTRTRPCLYASGVESVLSILCSPNAQGAAKSAAVTRKILDRAKAPKIQSRPHSLR